MTKKILIADEQELFRKCLVTILKDFFPESIFIEASTGEEVILLVEKEDPNIILMEIDLPTLNGLQTLRKLREIGTKAKIIMLTGKKAKEFIFVSKKYEANGYFTKSIAPDMLAEAILRIANSNLFICTEWFSLKFKENDRFIKGILDKLNTLTQREKELLQLFFEGLSTSEVSEKLNVRKKSVDNYKNQISKKMEFPPNTYFLDWVRKNKEIVSYLI